ncbi:MAG: hypothetical protein U0Q22_13040 [Acidimicrobiales bacterium]
MTARPGPALVRLTIPDEPEAWAAAGFAVVDSSVRLGPLELVCDPSIGNEPSFGFDAPHPLGLDTLAGLAWETISPEPAAPSTGAPPHPNGIDGVDHLVIMVPDLDVARDGLVGAGLEIRRERSATIGADAVTQLFAWAGDVLLEVVAPVGRGTDARLWGLALTAADLDATAAWFGDRCSPPRDAVQPGRRIATVRHEILGMAFTLAVMDRRS